jgi:DNA-binding NarL/FixJ family response regulator
MRPSGRFTHVEVGADRSGKDRPDELGPQTERRMRLLLFACHPNDAQRALKYGERMEIAFLPSYDLEEIRREILRFEPELITCGADLFLSVSSSRSSTVTARNKQSEPDILKGLAPPFVTPREAKVLAMIADGKTNDEIAKILNLSSRTVKRTLSSLFEQFKASNRTELASRAAKLRVLKNHD